MLHRLFTVRGFYELARITKLFHNVVGKDRTSYRVRSHAHSSKGLEGWLQEAALTRDICDKELAFRSEKGWVSESSRADLSELREVVDR